MCTGNVFEQAAQAIALGLHRDPTKWNIPYTLAERRRWAWFNVLRVERQGVFKSVLWSSIWARFRWLAFMLGRPAVFGNNQFDCLLPSSSDPYSSDKARDMDHQPFLHMFRLMTLFGDIMCDLTSVKPVPYEHILAHDKALEDWMTSFPPSLQQDVATLSHAFQGNDSIKREQGVQTMCLRLAGLHTRIALVSFKGRTASFISFIWPLAPSVCDEVLFGAGSII